MCIRDRPNAYPKKISVGTELEDLQAMVGGDIEVTYPVSYTHLTASCHRQNDLNTGCLMKFSRPFASMVCI